MEQPCMTAYSLLLIKTCHRRGIHAMGGMAAQIPVKNNPQANEAALVKVSPSSFTPACGVCLLHLPELPGKNTQTCADWKL